jgi:hypothetical protein
MPAIGPDQSSVNPIDGSTAHQSEGKDLLDRFPIRAQYEFLSQTYRARQARSLYAKPAPALTLTAELL